MVCLLTFNTFMTIFGAVGTPVWFGIGEVRSSTHFRSANGKVMRSGVALERSEIPYELHVCVLVGALSPYVPRIPERPWEPR